MKLFEDLPSTDTPINAENLNQIQDNLVVVSATEPTGDNREKVWIKKGKNLYDESKGIKGYAVSASTGEIYENAERKVSNLIQIEPNTQYVISNNGTETQLNYAIYDENKVYISGAVASKISTPSNAKYIRFYYGINDLSSMQLEQGSIATAYEEYIEPKMYVKNINNVYEKCMSKENLEVYSTDEISIGTWIDGRGLYRKVITAIIPSGTISTEVNINVPDYWVLTKLDYRLKANNSTNYAFGNYYASSTDFQRCFFREGAIQVRLGANNSGVEMLFVIEYTK